MINLHSPFVDQNREFLLDASQLLDPHQRPKVCPHTLSAPFLAVLTCENEIPTKQTCAIEWVANFVVL
jgi:hypothetical protein